MRDVLERSSRVVLTDPAPDDYPRLLAAMHAWQSVVPSTPAMRTAALVLSLSAAGSHCEEIARVAGMPGLRVHQLRLRLARLLRAIQ